VFLTEFSFPVALVAEEVEVLSFLQGGTVAASSLPFGRPDAARCVGGVWRRCECTVLKHGSACFMCAEAAEVECHRDGTRGGGGKPGAGS
jgi:hypothetical protein